MYPVCEMREECLYRLYSGRGDKPPSYTCIRNNAANFPSHDVTLCLLCCDAQNLEWCRCCNRRMFDSWVENDRYCRHCLPVLSDTYPYDRRHDKSGKYYYEMVGLVSHWFPKLNGDEVAALVAKLPLYNSDGDRAFNIEELCNMGGLEFIQWFVLYVDVLGSMGGKSS